MSKNHKAIDERELQHANVTAYALGELSADEAALFERSNALSGSSSGEAALQMEQARRLGQLLRADFSGDVVGIDSTTAESQCCSAQIRESVLAALDAQETTPAKKPISLDLNPRRRSRTRIWAWGLVASVAVAIGGMFWLPSIQIVREAARRDNKTQTVQSSEFESFGESVSKNVEAKSWDVNTSDPNAAFPILKVDDSLHGSAAVGGKGQQSSAPQGVDLQGGKKFEEGYIREAMIPPQAPGFELSSKDSPPLVAATTESPAKGSVDGRKALPLGRLLDSSIQPTTNDRTAARDTFFADSVSASELAGRIEPAPNFAFQGEQSERQSVVAGVNREIVLGLRGAGGGGFEGKKSQDEKESYGFRGYSGQNPANEQYKSIPENPFWRPNGERAMSTFSIDVDTASYANVRRFLNEGSLPPPDAVRLEEFINYFHYDYPQPEEGSPFAVDLKLFGCPWNAQHSLLRVGLHGREIEAEKRPISNIVYLVDVSGSMSDENKLPLLKRGLSMMVDHLGESDTVSIVTYAGDAGVKLEPTNGANKKKILDAIDSLQSGGSTNGAAGIEVAYRLAQQNFVKEGANRVILMTDGDLNVGVTSDEALVNIIKEKAASGVFLTVLGFGTGNLKDGKLEGLADNGNGIYGYIDSLGEAHKVLVEQMSGNLVTIAKDVKIQIEFNPAQVAGYRLIGYENRVMANQDFANDRKDAGEIGAGHTVTALYEIVPVGAMLDAVDPASPTLKYQTLGEATRNDTAQTKADIKLTDAAASGELARVALRFKTPEGTESRLIEFTAQSEVTSFSQADADCRFAAAVAAFGMRLRQSQFAGNITLDAIAEIASAATGPDPNGHRAEFVDLVRRAKELRSMRD